MKVRVLGPIEIDVRPGAPRITGNNAKVLAFLTLHAGRYVDVGDIIAEFWPEGVSGNPVTQAISSIRERLPEDPIATAPSQYRIEVETDVEDAERARSRTEALLRGGHPTEALEEAARGLSLWRGEAYANIGFHTQGNAALLDGIDELRCNLMADRLKAHWMLGDLTNLALDASKYLAERPTDDELNKYRLLAVLKKDITRYEIEVEQLRMAYEDNDQELSDDFDRPNLNFADELAAFGTVPQSGPGGHAGNSQLVRHNLPGATYGDFIRNDEFELLRDALGQNVPIVAVTAGGGRGKTSLVHRFCSLLVEEGTRFSAIVWVSDRQSPGSTTVATVINELAITTRNRELSKAVGAEAAQDALAILWQQPILVIIDNFETIVDEAFRRWITRVGGLSKVIITSAVFPRDIEDYCTVVKVRRPDDSKKSAFFAQVMRRTRRTVDSDVLDTIWAEGHGNYKLMEWAISHVGRRDVQSIIADLRGGVGEDGVKNVDYVKTELFRAGWGTLRIREQAVLRILACYPYGIPFEDLHRVASPSIEGDLFETLSSLVDLMFVDNDSVTAAYLIDDLVASRVRQLPSGDGDDSICAWLDDVQAIAASVGFCPGDIVRLETLDAPRIRKNIEYALEWAVRNEKWDVAINIGRDIRYFYYVRGLWSPVPDIFELRVQAARRAGNIAEEFSALVYVLNITAKQRNHDKANHLLSALDALVAQSPELLNERTLADYRHAKALHSAENGSRSEAHSLWEENLLRPDLLGPENLNANLRWYAISLIRSGDQADRRRGITILGEASSHAREMNYPRAQVLIDLELARLRLQDDDSEINVRDVLHGLMALRPDLDDVNDLRYDAEHHSLLAEAYGYLGDRAAALKHNSVAAEAFGALGMKYPARDDEESVR